MNNIQEKRDLKISYNKSGAGNVSARVILPITWVREMGLSQEFPAVIASFDGEKITIEANEEVNESYYYITIVAEKNGQCITDSFDNAFFRNVSKNAVKKEFQSIDVDYIKEWLHGDFDRASVDMWQRKGEDAKIEDPIYQKIFEIKK